MTRSIKILVLLGAITFMSSKVSSQISVSYYSSSLSKIGLSYNFSGKVWSELRLYSNTVADDLTPELVLCYNFVNKEKYNIYAGVGAVTNYYNGLIVPIGIQFTPFEELNNIRYILNCNQHLTQSIPQLCKVPAELGVNFNI